MSKIDAVLRIVSQNPVLPIEVATALAIDSFTAKAVLDFLTESGKIKATSEKIGGVPIYYLPGQELTAQAKLNTLLSVKPLVKNFSTEPIQRTPELEKKREEFLARLKEIERKEKEIKELEVSKKESEKISTEDVKIEEVNKIVDESLSITEKKETREISKIEIKNLIDLAHVWLENKKVIITNRELKKKGREAIFEFLLPSPIGNVPFICFVLDKKTITETDISLAHSESIKKARPVLILSKGKLAKNAIRLIESFNGLVRFEKLEEDS